PALTALTKAAAALDAGGHAVEDFSPYYGEDYHRDFRTVWTAGLLRAPLPEDAEAHVGAVAAHFLRTARGAGRAEIDDAAHRLEEWSRGVRAQFAAVDVVMTPVLATAPPPVGHFLAMEPEANYEAQCAFTPYTSMVNVLGLPAVAVPVLRDERGLNWSVQLIGRPGTSAPLLALAAHLELLLAG
ncbi:amidase family protein, partial [Streptomyces sp. NPDC051172]